MSAAKPSLSARMHFAWGQSCAYWGNKTLSKTLYRWAVNAFTRAAAEAPGWPAPVMRRAVIRGRELDDYAGAVRDLTELIENDSDSYEAYLQRGILHSFHGLHAAARAVDDFDRFLQLAPASHPWRPDAHNLTARLRGELAERGWDEDHPDEA
jgi:hypothetical protein